MFASKEGSDAARGRSAKLHTIAHRDRAVHCRKRQYARQAGLRTRHRMHEAHMLTNCTFPRRETQWLSTQFALLTYRCGGSAGMVF